MFDPFNLFDSFGAGRRRINPASFFLPGDVGFVYDPSNLASMFQDVAGTIPANQPGHPVGLRLDTKHGLALGPEMVTNGDNEAALSAAPSSLLTGFVSRQQSSDRARSGTYSAKLTASALSSTHYWALWTVPANVAVQVTGSIYIPAGATGGQNIKIVDTADGSVTQEIVAASAVDQWVDFRFFRAGKATAWPMALGQNVAANWSGEAIYIDNLSIREVAGIHATQSVAASRPTLARRPARGVRNLLTYTEDFTNGAWIKGVSGSASAPVVTPNYAASPNGTLTASLVQFRLNGATDSSFSWLYQNRAATTGDEQTLSIYVRAASGSEIGKSLRATGITSANIVLTNAWQRVEIPAVAATTATMSYGLRARWSEGTSDSVDVLIWGAQLEPGATATAYQRVGSVYDVTEAGQPDRWCLVTDGVDDGMVTPTITPAVGADKVQVVAGVRKLSDAAQGCLVELSSSALNGSMSLWAPPFANSGFAFWSKGSALSSNAYSNGPLSPASRVVVGIGDVSTDVATLRLNGEQAALSSQDQGAGQFGTYPAYLYRRGGTIYPAKIEDYGMICRISTTNLTAAQIGQLEAWVNQRTGAY